MPGINDRDIQSQAGLTAGTYTNATVTLNAEGVATAAASGPAPLLKRRLALTFQPAVPGTADTSPSLSQAIRLPKGSANAADAWKLMSATLRTEGPSASATTAQLYYASNPGNAAFGAGTAALSAALSLTGTGSYEASTTTFTGTLATTGLPSGSLLAPQFSALGGTKVSLEVEFEEV